MPAANQNIKPSNTVSSWDIQKHFHISRDLASNIFRYLNLEAQVIEQPKSGRKLYYYPSSTIESVGGFLKTHPNTKSFFRQLWEEGNPKAKTQMAEKRKSTMQTKYGCSNASQIPGMAARKLANFESSHGESFSSYMAKKAGSTEFQQKRARTLREHYGEDYISLLASNRVITPEARQKAAQTRKQTCIEKYGVDNPILVPEIYSKAKQNRAFVDNQALDYIHKQSGITEREILAKYDITDPCFRYHTQAAGIDIRRYKAFNYILQSELDLISDALLCVPTTRSGGEESLGNFLSSIYDGEILTNKRILPNKQEVDFYLPQEKIAIEFNRLYWHSESCGKGESYHLGKTEGCESLGIRLIQIYEDEWLYKRSICESIIRNALNKNEFKLYARQCQIKELSLKEYKSFMKENHIQGCGPTPRKAWGLIHKGTLVQAVGFGTSRYKKDEWELYRMACKLNTSVIGGFSKLLKHCELSSFISYVDRRLFTGEGYLKAGFIQVSVSKPSYFYIKGYNRYNRLEYQKHKLAKKLDVFDPSKTEKENMLNNGFGIIYDCGTLKMKWETEQ